MKKHIEGLNLNSAGAYLDWCEENGFPVKINKTEIEKRAENKFFRELKYATSLDGGKERISSVIGSIPHKHPHEDLIAFFTFLKKKTKLIHNKPTGLHRRKTYPDALQVIWHYRGRWVRSYEDWKPKSKNARKQFASLIRHLLTEYDLPLFMDKALFIDPVDHIKKGNDIKKLKYKSTPELEWFFGLCEGKNIRKMEKLPISLTKKQAHHFCEAPSHYDVYEAIRYGQVLGLGGSPRLAAQVITKLNFDLVPKNYEENYAERERPKFVERNEYWTQLIRIYVSNPMLDVHTFGEIVDYVNAQKVENPNYNFKGRTADHLYQRSEEWHAHVRKSQGKKFLEWKPDQDVQPFLLTEGRENEKSYKLWQIEQLMNSKELSAEGRALKHCVRSYSSSCKAGRCTIWSLKCNGERKLTIEVNTNNFRIVQAKGRANKSPGAVERRIMGLWANKNDLEVGSYL